MVEIVEKDKSIEPKSELVIQLPEAKEVERRLATVDLGINEFLQTLFSGISIFEKAELTSKQLILLLSYQIYKFYRESGLEPQSVGLHLLFIPDYIDALVDNKDFSKKTIDLYSEVLDERNNILIKVLSKIYQNTHPNGVISDPSSSLSFIPNDDEVEGLWGGLQLKR